MVAQVIKRAVATPSGARVPTWSLRDLFRSERDPALERTLSRVLRAARAFRRRYRGKIAALGSSPRALRTMLEKYEQLLQTAEKPVQYANLRFAESCADAARGGFLQQIKSRYLEISNELLFLELELLTISKADARTLVRHPALSRFRNFLVKIFAGRRYRLSEAEEQLLERCSLTGRSAFMRLFDEELSRKEFTLRDPLARGKALQLRSASETEVLSLLYHERRDVRRAAAEALTGGLREESSRLTFITNILAEDKRLEDALRRYEGPEQPRHLANEISQKMVDAMSAEVSSHYSVVQQFYRFKSKVLGLAPLYDYDRYAPVGRSEISFSWAQAQELVISSFSKFSPEYGAVAELFFTKGWIDAEPRKGKRSGAFCSFGTPDLHPYVFMSYNGTVRELFTLAHELGHAIHGYLMRKVGYLNFGVPLTIAETASVFAEMLLFEHVKQAVPPAERFALMMAKIESVFATVFRQVSMYRFEQDLHAARTKGELTTDQISALWRARQREMFGSSVQLTPNYDIWWSYIPHFLHTPFYVYAYAFGELLTLSLYARYQAQRGRFTAKYLELLSLGCSRSPAELLKPFGISLSDRAFWREGLALISSMVHEAQSLHNDHKRR